MRTRLAARVDRTLKLEHLVQSSGLEVRRRDRKVNYIALPVWDPVESRQIGEAGSSSAPKVTDLYHTLSMLPSE